jgi:hypothetical protein
VEKEASIKKRIAIIITCLALIGAIGIAVVASVRENLKGPHRPRTVVSTSPSSASTATARGANPTRLLDGYIEGPVSYPSEGIPPDIRVCAVNLVTSRESCTKKLTRSGRFRSGQGYRIAVPPGNYQVYAIAPSFDPGYQAFYSAFVVCGYRTTCADHSPITITVRSGQTRSGIEPGDFYDN